MRIYDNHGRPIEYLRLSVTDRCNLRCFYCMPAEGISYLPKKELLSYEEMYRLVKALTEIGVTKVRITGGEPFVRKDLVHFIGRLAEIDALSAIGVTTNGTLIAPWLADLKKLGVSAINLSLDAADRNRFFEITRRDEFDKVWHTLHLALKQGFEVKVNMVVMAGKNEGDIIPMAELTGKYPVSVRYIEEMPFNGSRETRTRLKWDHTRILDRLRKRYGEKLYKLSDPPSSTAVHYRVDGYPGSLGVIPAFTRTFCGACNRIRITAQGSLKTCLYDRGALDLKRLLRSGASDKEIKEQFLNAFSRRPKDGFEAEKESLAPQSFHESMSAIGG